MGGHTRLTCYHQANMSYLWPDGILYPHHADGDEVIEKK
jgi:hypothetical protein